MVLLAFQRQKLLLNCSEERLTENGAFKVVFCVSCADHLLVCFSRIALD